MENGNHTGINGVKLRLDVESHFKSHPKLAAVATKNIVLP